MRPNIAPSFQTLPSCPEIDIDINKPYTAKNDTTLWTCELPDIYDNGIKSTDIVDCEIIKGLKGFMTFK